MANFGKIYESSWWGEGVCTNTIDWGSSYKSIANCTPAPPSFTNTYSLAFDGVDDYVDCGTIQGIRNVTKASFSCWLYRDNTTPNQLYGVSVSSGNRVGLVIISNQLRFYVGSVKAEINNFITSNGWYHILVTYDGTQATGPERVKVYKNGQNIALTNSPSIPATFPDLNSSFKIGLFTISYLQDNIDEFSIYDYTLTQANVNTIFNSGVPNNLANLTTPPIHWWRMGDGDTFPTLTDNSGSNNGTMTNMTSGDIVEDVPS